MDSITKHVRGGHNLINRVGQRYGKLVVIERYGSKGNYATWLCRCDCNYEKLIVVTSACLRAGYTRSCGCSRKTGKNSRKSYKYKYLPGEAAKKGLKHDYCTVAKNKGLTWELSDDQFYYLIQQACFYCNSPPSRVRKISKNGHIVFNGVDRVDNSKGYITTNVVTCCHTCNHAKCTMSQEEFESWIERVFLHTVDRRNVRKTAIRKAT